MNNASNKRELNLIVRRWLKGIVLASSPAMSFGEVADLTEEQIEYMENKVKQIAQRITELDPGINAGDLIEEYFETEQQ